MRKTYFANHWKVIRKLFQVLSFTNIEDKHILSDNVISESFAQSCEKFIELWNQSLLFFSFKFHAKKKPDLTSAIKTINAIIVNWCGYIIKSEQKLIGPKEQRV